MQAIIPAAGLGTRMLPFSAVAAKELAPIGTRPMIQWTLAEAAALGIESAVVVISPEKTQLQKFLEGDINPDLFGIDAVDEWMALREKLSITIALQPKPRGLGDALLRGWQAGDADSFYLMYPDNIVLYPENVYKSVMVPFEQHGSAVIACKADRPYFSGNHFIYFGDDVGDAFRVEKVTVRDDPPPKKKDVCHRGAGRVMVSREYFDALELIASEGVEGELDDIHAYNFLTERGRLLAAEPASIIHDGGTLEGYKDAWLAYITGELEY